MIPSPLLLYSASSSSSSMIFSAGSSREALPLLPTTKYHYIFSRRRHKSCLNQPSLLFATMDNDQANPNNRAGSYVDLGTITSSNESAEDSFLQNLFLKSYHHNSITPPPPSPSGSSYNNSISQWRSNHWIVLIDDEPSIRLAIGDYLHSMGYTMITACDGPQSFLDVLLYSCGWSLLIEDGEEEDNSPPWMDGENMLWRLPNCIISDIRMPGGVDGVQLLELLRHDKTTSSFSEDDDVKKGRRAKKKGQRIRRNNEYDGKDDFELLDAIVGSSSSNSGSNNDGGGPTGTTKKHKQQNNQDEGKIVTAIDQARQKLNVIRDTLSYHQEAASNNNNNNLNSLQQQQQQTQQQYPTSLLQIPVILLTAKAMVSDRIVGFKAGANNYLPKPFRPEELLGMVDSLLRKQERETKEWRNDVVVGGGGGNIMEEEEEVDVKYVNEIAMYSASAQQIKDLTTELVEIKNLLKEEAQREINIKVEQEVMGRLTELLPNAIWMFLNNERRKRLFTSDHIRSILLFCFDDASLARKNTVKRDELLSELERLNDEHPDIVKNFLA